MFEEVCRLCLGTEDLLWLFDDQMAPNMNEIIEVTSGVKITKSDTITQMVCSTCCQITIKMFKFRTTSIKNDKDLKAKCAGYNISRLTDSIIRTPKKEAPSSSFISSAENATSINTSPSTGTPKINPPIAKNQIPQKYKFAHPSIKEILKQHPNIKLPEISMTSHFGAYITLLTDEVDDWFKEKNLSDDQIAEIKKAAFEYANASEHPKLQQPVSQTTRKRKFSAERRSLSPNKKSNPDKNPIENVTKNKRTKLNGENISKPSKVSVGTVVKSSPSSTVNSKSESKVNASVTSNVKTSGESNVKTEKPRKTVKSDVNSEVKSNVNQTKSPNSENSAKLESILDALLPNDVPTKNRNDEITITSILQPNVSAKKNSTEPVVDSDEDPSYDPTNDPCYDSAHEAEEMDILEMNEQSSKNNKNKQPPKSNERERSITSSERAQPPKSTQREQLSKSTKHEQSPKSKEREQPPKSKEREQPPKSSEREQSTKSSESSQNPKNNVQSQNLTKKIYQVKPLEDFTLFTTRPFIRTSGETRRKTARYKFRLEACEKDNTELLVLSDSDDDHHSPSRATNQSDSNPVVVDVDSSDGSTKAIDKPTEQTNSAISQELTPSQPSNMPDLSLVSLANKTCTLYICKVCDSHHTSMKDLKSHERKTHTKCPFCTKRFRSLASRDEHVKYTCIINNSPFELKNPKLQLTRVDEVDEIRKKYASAFEVLENNNETEKVESEVIRLIVEPAPQSPEKETEKTDNNKGEYDVETDDTVRELEEFLHIPGVSSDSNTSTSETAAAESVVESTPTNVDIICISDEEADTSTKSGSAVSKPKIKIVNNDILKNINLHDSDLNILKKILSEVKLRRMKAAHSIDALKNNVIVDGTTTRVKIFKNLRKHLQHYKIPIEIQYSPTLNVEYKYSKVPPSKKLTDLWHTMVAHDVKIPTSAPVRMPNTTIQNAPLLIHSQLNSASQNVMTTASPYRSAVNEITGQANMAQVAQFNSLSSGGSVVTSSGLVYTSHPTLVNSYNNDHNYTATSPLILNGAQTMCGTATGNRVTNFIIVPNGIKPSNDITNATVLPAAQGPLPIIQSVTTAVDLEEPTAESAASACPPTNSTVQPAIRVKNLSELS